MKKIAILLLLLLIVSAAGVAVAGPFGPGGMIWRYVSDYVNINPGYGFGPRMMSRYGFGVCPVWNTGWGFGGSQNKANITVDEAVKIAENYLSTSGYSDLKIDDVYEFNSHFEVEFVEKITNLHAFEILINKFTGVITPEMGPNTMWNTKYGHMYYAPDAKMSITGEQARDVAKNWLASYNSNLTLGEEAEVYYGYYEIHVKQDGRTTMQININGFTGQVWLESWHGILLNEKEF